MYCMYCMYCTYAYCAGALPISPNARVCVLHARTPALHGPHAGGGGGAECPAHIHRTSPVHAQRPPQGRAGRTPHCPPARTYINQGPPASFSIADRVAVRVSCRSWRVRRRAEHALMRNGPAIRPHKTLQGGVAQPKRRKVLLPGGGGGPPCFRALTVQSHLLRSANTRGVHIDTIEHRHSTATAHRDVLYNHTASSHTLSPLCKHI